MKDSRWKVGIDLGPAGRGAQAPGTARLVQEQARALFKLDLPWTWVPVLSRGANPLREEIEHLQPVESSFQKASLHASFGLGAVWRRHQCQLGFCTAFFTPFIGPRVVANYFDSNFFEPVDAWNRRNRTRQYFLMRSLLRYSVARAKKLFILSHYGRARMSAIFPQHADKFVVTPCGIRQPGTPDSQPPDWATPLNNNFFLYVGAFSDNKNQGTLLKAWHILQQKDPNAPRLALIGPPREQYMQEVILPLHRSLPRPEEVVIPGFTSERDLNWAYWNAIAYIQPSFAEGFGMPILEAMSCGLPVACSDSTSLPETAGGNALLFDPKDATSIAARVEELYRNPTLRSNLGHAGRMRAMEFTWEKNAQIIANTILEQLRLGA